MTILELFHSKKNRIIAIQANPVGIFEYPVQNAFFMDRNYKGEIMMNNYRILVLILAIALLINDLKLAYRYYKKLNSEEKKKYCKDIGLVGVISVISWSALMYGIFDITDIATLCIWSLAMTGLIITVVTGRHIRFDS